MLNPVFFPLPKPATCKRYGMTLLDYRIMAKNQNNACSICQKPPKDKPLCIDHVHVKGWKKMKPAERKGYVRGLLCNRCNWRFLPRGMTTEYAYGLAYYLARYDSKQESIDSQTSPV